VLDLSYVPQLATPSAMSALLQPPKARLPSLRVLGLRSRTPASDGTDEPGSPSPVVPLNAAQREIRTIVRDPARPGLIDIIW
jgi:hypothetical protein